MLPFSLNRSVPYTRKEKPDGSVSAFTICKLSETDREEDTMKRAIGKLVCMLVVFTAITLGVSSTSMAQDTGGDGGGTGADSCYIYYISDSYRAERTPYWGGDSQTVICWTDFYECILDPYSSEGGAWYSHYESEFCCGWNYCGYGWSGSG